LIIGSTFTTPLELDLVTLKILFVFNNLDETLGEKRKENMLGKISTEKND
jgi:hypothetical protein